MCGGSIYQATSNHQMKIKRAGECCSECQNKDILICSPVDTAIHTAFGYFKQCVKVTPSIAAVIAENDNIGALWTSYCMQ